ncbi:MAG: hypothetical protein HOV87_18630 [Catenulispora sp.]|nr:hypothetical protein [Catenulispora sp.]
MAFDSLDGAVRPWRTGLLAAAASAGGVAIAGAGLVLPSESAQAVTNVATGTLVNLTTDAVPPLGLSGFHGAAATSGLAQNGGDNAADTSQDPDGVLKHLTINGPAQSKTHADPVKNWAKAQMVSAAASFSSGKQLYTIASLDSYAECTSPPTGPSAMAYVHADADAVKVLGTTIPAGKTTAVSVTGAQLGVTGVDHGSLRVAYTTTATPAVQTAGVTSAHAHLDLTIAGTFYDAGGKEIFNGQVQKVRFGDVSATCENSAPTPPSSTSTLPTTPATPTSPMTPTSPTSPTGPTPATGTPTPTAPTTGPPAAPTAPVGSTPATGHTAAHPHHSKHHGGSGGANGPENGPMQPAGRPAALSDTGTGGGPSVWWAALSVTGLGGGAALYLLTRRRGKQGKHQH